MMVLRIEIAIDNSAFEPEPSIEVARILGDVAYKVAAGFTRGGCLDINGNLVGSWACLNEAQAAEPVYDEQVAMEANADNRLGE